MNKKTDKLKSEFDEKLREGHTNDPVGDSVRQDAYIPGSAEEIRLEERNRLEEKDEHIETIPVIEERVQVDKDVVETGRVRISKDVHEEEVTVDLPTVFEETDIERVEINQYVDTPPPPIRYEGDKMIIPVTREVLVVEKRILVVEELHITKRRTEKHDTEQVTLRREEVRVDRQRNENLDPDRR
ncbi:YsnF/AvaK domain-containing protein [Pontibacter roseus]|uniref:YsnF/AvaK domain-containing protein n=1 Tax=Pontibacter roseus TaxID=336989 RepID=UPI000377939D|nr:YsnF/AvaK domain-containing protein [Pontibacter roseus]